MSPTPHPSFEIAAIESFHITTGDHNYWRDFRAANRQETDRFVLKPGWRTVYGKRVETCVVKVTLASGHWGWGEATEPICPEIVGQLATRVIGPVSRGVTFDTVEEFVDFAYDLNRGRGHQSGYQLLAIAAIDIALCDALAKGVGKPLAALFGGQPRHSVPLYLSGIRRNTLDQRVDHLNALVAQGLSAVKVFVDADTESTLAEVVALRRRVPGDWSLMVDALWSYERPEAAAVLSAQLADHGVKWLECPLPPEDLDGHRVLRAAGGVPIALGETFFTAHQLQQWLGTEALDVFQPDIGRTGFAGGLRQAKMADEAGLSVTPHMGTGSPVVQAAAMHFHAAAGRGHPCEYQMELASLLPDAFHSHWQVQAGMAALPDAPGLGVEVDEAALAHHTVERHLYRAD